MAQGMLDLALLSANANQLRYVLDSNERNHYYYVSLTLISSSLVLQVLVAIALVFKSRYNVDNAEDYENADRINNFIMIGILMITITNVVSSAFAPAPISWLNTLIVWKNINKTFFLITYTILYFNSKVFEKKLIASNSSSGIFQDDSMLEKNRAHMSSFHFQLMCERSLKITVFAIFLFSLLMTVRAFFKCILKILAREFLIRMRKIILNFMLILVNYIV